MRGGGHSHAGYGVADGALMLDLSAMVSVWVDLARRVATVGGGATWGVVDQATQAAGLAVTGADVSPVGVAGATRLRFLGQVPVGGGPRDAWSAGQRVSGGAVAETIAAPAPACQKHDRARLPFGVQLRDGLRQFPGTSSVAR